MERITIYHGSEGIRQVPVFGEGNLRNDYGLGFYCTESLDLAKEWACAELRDGYANKYSLDQEGLSILNLNGPGFHILNWLAILLENRTFDIKTPLAREARSYILEHFLPDYKTHDILVGYRADDSYFSFSRAFLENSISLEQLQRAMKLGRLGEQVVLKSREAFDHITFEEAIPADGGTFHARRIARDRQAREDFAKILAETPAAEAVYMVDIIRQKWQNDDERI